MNYGERVGEKGFTNEITEYLGWDNLEEKMRRGIARFDSASPELMERRNWAVPITAEQYIHIVENGLMPVEMLGKTQNWSPSMRDFYELAKREPEARFIGYLVPEERWDERLSFDGCILPEENQELIDFLYEEGEAEDKADEYNVADDGSVRLWWD